MDLDFLTAQVQMLTKERGHDDPRVAASWIRIGQTLNRRGHDGLALEALEQAIKSSMGATATPQKLCNLAEAYSNIAKVHWNRGDKTLAIEYLAQSVDAYRQCPKTEERLKDMSAVLHWLGITLKDQGEYEKAEVALLQAIELRQEDSTTLAQTLEAIGELTFMQENYEIALSYFEEAFSLSVGKPRAMICLRKMSESYQEMGDHAAALFGFRALFTRQEKPLLDENTDGINKKTLRREMGVSLM